MRDEWLGRVLDDAALVWGYVIARVEIDYRRELTLEDDVVVARCSLDRLGTKVELAFLQDLAEGTFVSDCLTRADIARARSLVATS